MPLAAPHIKQEDQNRRPAIHTENLQDFLLHLHCSLSFSFISFPRNFLIRRRNPMSSGSPPKQQPVSTSYRRGILISHAPPRPTPRQHLPKKRFKRNLKGSTIPQGRQQPSNPREPQHRHPKLLRKQCWIRVTQIRPLWIKKEKFTIQIVWKACNLSPPVLNVFIFNRSIVREPFYPTSNGERFDQGSCGQ